MMSLFVVISSVCAKIFYITYYFLLLIVNLWSNKLLYFNICQKLSKVLDSWLMWAVVWNSQEPSKCNQSFLFCLNFPF